MLRSLPCHVVSCVRVFQFVSVDAMGLDCSMFRWLSCPSGNAACRASRVSAAAVSRVSGYTRLVGRSPGFHVDPTPKLRCCSSRRFLAFGFRMHLHQPPAQQNHTTNAYVMLRETRSEADRKLIPDKTSALVDLVHYVCRRERRTQSMHVLQRARETPASRMHARPGTYNSLQDEKLHVAWEAARDEEQSADACRYDTPANRGHGSRRWTCRHRWLRRRPSTLDKRLAT